MRGCEADQFVDDLLGQVWWNSEILADKFDGVRGAAWSSTEAAKKREPVSYGLLLLTRMGIRAIKSSARQRVSEKRAKSYPPELGTSRDKDHMIDIVCSFSGADC
jgi:hypothetical protein